MEIGHNSPWIPVRSCLMCNSKNLKHDVDNEFVKCLDCGYGGGGANFWEWGGDDR